MQPKFCEDCQELRGIADEPATQRRDGAHLCDGCAENYDENARTWEDDVDASWLHPLDLEEVEPW